MNPQNILISNIKGRKAPRLCLLDRVYPIGIEIEKAKIPFGIDVVYGKRYMKIEIDDPTIIQQMMDIERRLQQLEPNLFSAFSGPRQIQTILDRNVKITNQQGEVVSSYAIDRGLDCSVLLELGDIYQHNSVSNYKWITKSIILR